MTAKKEPKKRVAIYARVSTTDKGQDPENQLMQLRTWCAQAGHEIVQEYVEHESGRKGAEARKALSALLSDAHQRKFDLVLFWALDRFSREGMAKTVTYLQRLSASNVAFHSYTEEMLSTDNELVRDILIAVMSSLAKQEAIRLSKRTKAGLDRARAKGKTLGRPSTPAATLKAIQKAKKKEPAVSQRELARRFKVARAVVKAALSH